jgi:serine/threonine protein kinase
VCDAVSFAHAHGIIHRDLKPENVMVGPFGEVLVMDWGIASVLGSERRSIVGGTPGFMAPEQTSGAANPIDPRTDVYALGALLASMSPAPVPKRIAAIAQRARERRPQDRYGSVEALAKDVVRFRDGDEVEAYRESFVERTERVYQRYRLPILLVMAYMVMRVALLVWARI